MTTIIVLKDGQEFLIFKANAVPRQGDVLFIKDSYYTIKSVLWMVKSGKVQLTI
jgi:hypothetical protein